MGKEATSPLGLSQLPGEQLGRSGCKWRPEAARLPGSTLAESLWGRMIRHLAGADVSQGGHWSQRFHVFVQHSPEFSGWLLTPWCSSLAGVSVQPSWRSVCLCTSFGLVLSLGCTSWFYWRKRWYGGESSECSSQ